MIISLMRCRNPIDKKYSLIDHNNLPSASYEAVMMMRRDERMSDHSVYLAGKIVGGGNARGLVVSNLPITVA